MNFSTFRKNTLLAVAAVAVSTLAPAAAFAAEVFSFLGTNSNTSNTYGNVRTFTGSEGTKVEVSAYSRSGSGSSTSLTSSYVGQYFGSAANQYGLGVTSRNGDTAHEIDNSGRIDFVILQFDKVMTVSELGIYGFGDTDLTWAVGTTNTAFSSTLSIPNWSTLDNLFGTFMASSGPNSNSLQSRAITGATSGNLFLVAASMTAGTNDNFKLNSITATGAVPEPATWAMMIGGFALAGMSMRRRSATAKIQFA